MTVQNESHFVGNQRGQWIWWGIGRDADATATGYACWLASAVEAGDAQPPAVAVRALGFHVNSHEAIALAEVKRKASVPGVCEL
jgi:hypothetical protein